MSCKNIITSLTIGGFTSLILYDTLINNYSKLFKYLKKKILEHHYHLRQTMFNNQSKFSKPTHQNLLEVEGDEGVLKEGLELEEGLEGAKRSWRTIRAIIRINGFLLDFLSTIFLCFFF